MQTTVTNGEITTVFDVAEFNVNVGESAKIDVNEAVNYIQSGKAEIEKAVQQGKQELDTEGQIYVDLAKDWAIKTDGTVDGSEYSSKYWAEQSASAAATVGNGTITITQDGVTKGTFTTNQSGNTTIEIDKELFVAEYGVTPFADILGAVNNGKYVICVESAGNINVVYLYRSNTASSVSFFNCYGTGIDFCFVDDTETWDTTSTGINDASLRIQKNGSNVATFTANSSSDVTANITVPTATSDLTNDSGYITGISSGNVTTALGYTPANTDLSNLTANGQMIIDSQNGTISNCILEIPQNIKVTLENNVITHKAGSIFVLRGNTYATYTLPQDKSLNLTNVADGKYVIFAGGDGTPVYTLFNKSFSGSTLPQTATNGDRFYKTDDKTFWYYNNGWTASGVMYPSCIVEIVGGVASFAKDENGNDMIFNGMGFIGSTLFVYPFVKGLIPNGRNEDGSLKSTEFVTNSLQIITANYNLERDGYIYSTLGRGHLNQTRDYTEVDALPENPRQWATCYLKPENMQYRFEGTNWSKMTNNIIFAITHRETSNPYRIISLTPRQPYEGARNLLTDNKQANLTTLTGYDATQTQTLKNINGVLTWVTDGE